MHVSNSPHHRVVKIAAAAFGVALAVTGCASGGSAASSGQPASTTTTTTTSTSASLPADTAQGGQCGGVGIDRSASITRSSDIVVNAPVQRVWDAHTAVESWNQWQQAVLTIERLDQGPFSAGSQFRWTTPVPESQLSPADTLTITSSVKQVEPRECVIWEGPAIGKSITIDRGVHLWTFTEVDGRTGVHTEESWKAPLLDSLQGPDRDAAAAMLGGGLDLWLQALKTKVETP